jgi:hypothetical protein
MRGWPSVLCAALILWRPLDFVFELLSSLSSIGMRGVAGGIELLLHGGVAALSIAAVRALGASMPVGPPLAAVALVGSAAATVQSLYWSVLPHQTPPGTQLPLATLGVAHALVWLIYLKRSRRIREIARS